MEMIVNGSSTRPEAGPAVTRTVTDFVAVFLDRTAAADGPWTALREAALAVRTTGAEDLRAVIDAGRSTGMEHMLDRLSELAAAWRTPVLESLAAALRHGGVVSKSMQQYLLAGAQAEAIGAVRAADTA